MRKITAFLKIILAGFTAVAVLCGIFTVYSLEPVHIPNSRGNTDYIWPARSVWSQMREGISWGRYDANGYNNQNIIENPDVLILGSSHMEAMNVLQDQHTASVLNEILNGKYRVYNMGISGHHFTKVCKYLPVTMELYDQAPKVIIIETDNTFFRQNDVEQLLQGKIDTTPSHNSGLIATLQKFPFFRLVYRQLTGGLLDLLLTQEQSKTWTSSSVKPVDETAYDALFTYIHDVIKNYDTQVIIFYHPFAKLNKNGSVTFDNDPGTHLFSEKCAEYGITFVNMEDAFSRMYTQEHTLPHGFTNAEIGQGHLNADGHRCIAQELADVITKLEEAGTLCK